MEKYYSVNRDSCSIRCKLIYTDPGRITAAVLFGHGFGGHKDTRAAVKLAARLQKRHPTVALVAFDWPCHGEDAGGRLRLEDCLHYLALMIDDTKQRLQIQTLYGCATSFGGYLFLRYLALHGNPFERLALRSPAVPMYALLTGRIMTAEELALLARGKPAAVGFDRKVRITRDFLAELQAADISQVDYRPYSDALVILHGTKDEIVPFEAVEAFAGRNGIPFFPIEAADHRCSDPKKMDEAIEIILESFF